MPSAAEREDGVGTNLVDQVNDAVDAVGIVVAERAVLVAEEAVLGDAEHRHRGVRLPAAHLTEPGRGPDDRVGRAVLAGGGRDADDPIAVVDRGGHDPGREVGLVVGVGPDRQDRSGHGRQPVAGGVGSYVGHATEHRSGRCRRARIRSPAAGAEGSAVTATTSIIGPMTMTLIQNPTKQRIELPTDMLERFRARAGELDRTNAYFDEDLAELRAAGYLAAAVPSQFGGGGLTPAELAASQRRLARYAPATALAMSMHSYWIGIAAELEQSGDPSLRWILDAATDGEVFAAGHAEAGNDIPVLLVDLPGRARRGWLPIHGSQAVRVERAGVALARRPCHRRFGAGRAAGRARLHRSFEPGAHGGRDLEHAGHASDPEPRHHPRRRVRARRSHRACDAGG